MTERQPERKLGIRGYLELISPFMSREQLRRRAEDPRPFSVREYISISPLPNLDDFIDLYRGARRLVKGVLGR